MKQINEYIGVLGGGVYEKTPKAVLAAIAVSFAARLGGEAREAEDGKGDELQVAQEVVLKEWQTLYDNGIVKQKPYKLDK